VRISIIRIDKGLGPIKPFIPNARKKFGHGHLIILVSRILLRGYSFAEIGAALKKNDQQYRTANGPVEPTSGGHNTE
jgi:hypothetical protein